MAYLHEAVQKDPGDALAYADWRLVTLPSLTALTRPRMPSRRRNQPP